MARLVRLVAFRKESNLPNSRAIPEALAVAEWSAHSHFAEEEEEIINATIGVI